MIPSPLRLVALSLPLLALSPGVARADEPAAPPVPAAPTTPAAPTARTDEPPPPAETPRRRFVVDPVTDVGMLSAAVGFSGLLQLIIGTGELTPQPPTSKDRLLSIDRAAVTQTVDPGAAKRSDIGATSAYVYAAIAPFVTVLQYGSEAGFVDAVMYAESAAFAWSATNLAKIAVRRPRPLAYQRQEEFARTNPGQPFQIEGTDTALSFFSGHTSNVAALSATATYLAFARSPHSARPWITLAVGTLLTGFVGYERVRAGKHFPTDVIAGALAGAGIGVIVPHLHREESVKQRPYWIGGAVDGQQATVSLSGRF